MFQGILGEEMSLNKNAAQLELSKRNISLIVMTFSLFPLKHPKPLRLEFSLFTYFFRENIVSRFT